jgi:hypothetical protein
MGDSEGEAQRPAQDPDQPDDGHPKPRNTWQGGPDDPPPPTPAPPDGGGVAEPENTWQGGPKKSPPPTPADDDGAEPGNTSGG